MSKELCHALRLALRDRSKWELANSNTIAHSSSGVHVTCDGHLTVYHDPRGTGIKLSGWRGFLLYFAVIDVLCWLVDREEEAIRQHQLRVAEMTAAKLRGEA